MCTSTNTHPPTISCELVCGWVGVSEHRHTLSFCLAYIHTRTQAHPHTSSHTLTICLFSTHFGFLFSLSAIFPPFSRFLVDFSLFSFQKKLIDLKWNLSRSSISFQSFFLARSNRIPVSSLSKKETMAASVVAASCAAVSCCNGFMKRLFIPSLCLL